jgi:Sel1 repeat
MAHLPSSSSTSSREEKIKATHKSGVSAVANFLLRRQNLAVISRRRGVYKNYGMIPTSGFFTSDPEVISMVDDERHLSELTTSPTEDVAYAEILRLHKLGSESSNKREQRDAFSALLIFAEQGYADAQNIVGQYYAFGHGVDESMVDAVAWYRKAGEQGHCAAQYSLGRCYEKGAGVLQSWSEAAKWYTAAGAQAHVAAQFSLGKLYETGKGVTKSIEEAINLYREAAKRRNADALFALGKCYEHGVGVARSWDEARKFYKDAVRLGSKEAAQEISKQKGRCPFCADAVSPEVVDKWWKYGPFRDKCVCPKCDNVIYTCRTPGCHHYAKGTTGYNHQFCGECIENYGEKIGQIATAIIVKTATSVLHKMVERQFGHKTDKK